MRFLLIFAGLLLLASPALAGGFDLSWDACVGSPSATTSDVAPCSDTDATQSLYVVFYPDHDMANFIGLDFEMRLIPESSDPELPPFWFYGNEGCNPFLAIATAASSGGCPGTLSPWSGVSSNYEFDLLIYDGQERGRLRGSVMRTTSAALPLQAGQRYLAYRLDFAMEAASLLAGCSTPMTVGVRDLVLYSTTDDSQTLTSPVTGWYCVTLNGSSGTACGVADFPPPGPGEVPSDRTCGPTAIRDVTWGAIKTLYR